MMSPVLYTLHGESGIWNLRLMQWQSKISCAIIL